MRFLALATVIALTTSVHAADNKPAEAQALDIAKRAIAFRSVAGPGNQTPQLAAYLKEQLVAGGFKAGDVTITPVDDTAYMIVRWPGKDAKAKPLVISGHIDVVEAKPTDWRRDPFTPVVENGYLYGRGATDMKLDAALAMAALIELKRQGYVPKRDIILEFSGDEETAMKTSAMIAETLKNAELVINIDGGGGRARRKDRQATLYDVERRRKDLCRFRAERDQPRRPQLRAAQGQCDRPVVGRA